MTNTVIFLVRTVSVYQVTYVVVRSYTIQYDKMRHDMMQYTTV